jgi:hypothetical protein
MAQFIYLLRNNERIRHVIETITSKVVLILGRFSMKQKPVLNAIREELRQHDYLPVLFDFDVPISRDIDETVNLLARMARFIIVDLSNVKSVPQELKGIVEALPSVPIQPIIRNSNREYGMFEHFRRYPWVLKPYCYTSQREMISKIHQGIIKPAEREVRRNLARLDRARTRPTL